MAWRFVQIFVPEGTRANVEELLEGCEIAGTWRDAVLGDRVVLHLLLPAEETEPVLDRLQQASGATAGFRVVLFPVEAVLPRPEARNSTATFWKPWGSIVSSWP